MGPSGPFIQRCLMAPLSLKLSYEPELSRGIDVGLLRQGATSELLKLVPLSNSQFKFAAVDVAGVMGWPSLYNHVKLHWLAGTFSLHILCTMADRHTRYSNVHATRVLVRCRRNGGPPRGPGGRGPLRARLYALCAVPPRWSTGARTSARRRVRIPHAAIRGCCLGSVARVWRAQIAGRHCCTCPDVRWCWPPGSLRIQCVPLPFFFFFCYVFAERRFLQWQDRRERRATSCLYRWWSTSGAVPLAW